LTFAGVAAAVCYTGAEPHFVDCRLSPLGALNAFKMRKHLLGLSPEARGRVKAVVAVDLLGHPGVDLELAHACAQCGLPLVEDAAAALGSVGDSVCGSGGVAAAMSFNHNKIVTMGGGGAVLTSDGDLAGRVRHLAQTAKVPSPYFYEHDAVGFNYRPSNLGAAFALAQMPWLDDILLRKAALHASYAEALAFTGNVDVTLVRPAPGSVWNGWLNSILVDPRHAFTAATVRDNIMKSLSAAGYESRALFTPLHKLGPYRMFPRQQNLGVAEDLFSRSICLPSGV
jgi:perosamine synthetase